MCYVIKIANNLFISEYITDIRTTNFKLKAVKFDTKEQAKPALEKLVGLYKNIDCLNPIIIKVS